MTNLVLWKRLTETDFNAMNAEASPHGAGGGARHIALGVRNGAFPIDTFAGTPGQMEANVEALSPAGAIATLDFYSNPDRRGGEWTIRNQYSHRHPAWSAPEGFPAAYDGSNPPYVLIFHVGDRFYARFAEEYDLDAKWRILPENMLSDGRGIAPASPDLLLAFGIPVQPLLRAFEAQEVTTLVEAFDPANIEDGRRAIFASIIRRQGQASFRKTLFEVYAGRCAITGATTKWVLEAAHITPYRGLETNAPQNGLLLRADVHTLFDMGLVSVRPADRVVRISSLLKDSDYWSLDKKALLKPTKQEYLPSEAALRQHFSQFHE